MSSSNLNNDGYYQSKWADNLIDAIIGFDPKRPDRKVVEVKTEEVYGDDEPYENERDNVLSFNNETL